MYFSSLMGGGTGTTAPKYGSGSGIGGLLGGPQLPMAAKQNTGSGPIPGAPAQLPKDNSTLSALTQSPLAMAQLKSLFSGGSTGSNGNLNGLLWQSPTDPNYTMDAGLARDIGLMGSTGGSGSGGGGLLGSLLSYL